MNEYTGRLRCLELAMVFMGEEESDHVTLQQMAQDLWGFVLTGEVILTTADAPQMQQEARH